MDDITNFSTNNLRDKYKNNNNNNENKEPSIEQKV